MQSLRERGACRHVSSGSHQTALACTDACVPHAIVDALEAPGGLDFLHPAGLNSMSGAKEFRNYSGLSRTR
jgi:hypothetical protein